MVTLAENMMDDMSDNMTGETVDKVMTIDMTTTPRASKKYVQIVH